METQQTFEDAGAETQPPPLDAPMLNPLAQLVSHFEADPFWDEMLESIRRNRHEMDAAWDIVE